MPDLKDLMTVDDDDEQLYTMVAKAKAIAKAARIARLATQEYQEAQSEMQGKKARMDAATQKLTDLILST